MAKMCNVNSATYASEKCCNWMFFVYFIAYILPVFSARIVGNSKSQIPRGEWSQLELTNTLTVGGHFMQTKIWVWQESHLKAVLPIHFALVLATNAFDHFFHPHGG